MLDMHPFFASPADTYHYHLELATYHAEAAVDAMKAAVAAGLSLEKPSIPIAYTPSEEEEFVW